MERALPGPGHADLVRGALASGAAVRSVEVRVEGRVLSWSYHPHPPLGLVHLFGEDVTARRAMEGQSLVLLNTDEHLLVACLVLA